MRWLGYLHIRFSLNVSWNEHKIIKKLYGKLPRVSETLQIRRLRFIGDCWRRNDETIFNLLLWEAIHGKSYTRKEIQRTPLLHICGSVDRRHRSGQAKLKKDAMEDRAKWKKLIKDVRVQSRQN